MSTSERLHHRLKARVGHVLTTPMRTYRDLRYTARGVRTGEIPPRELAMTVLGTLGGLLLTMLLMFPVYWVFLAAVSGPGASIYAAGKIHLIPPNATLKSFVWVLGDLIIHKLYIGHPAIGYVVIPRIELLDASAHGVQYPSAFKHYLWNSLTIAIPTVILAMSFVVPGAYALSRREFLGRSKIMYTYILFTQIGGGLGIATLIALYALFVQFGVTNNKLVLSVYYAATAIPFNTWLLKTFLDGIPTSYEEAAYLDGASSWQVVVEVILPLAKPGLATVFIFTFLTGWTEFVVAQTVLASGNYTLSVGLYALVGEFTLPWSYFSAFALTFALPIMAIYMYAQSYLETGLSFGA